MKQRFSTRTRLVSALLTLAMVFTFLPFSAFAAGEGRVPIGEDNYGPFYFPDSTFRTYLRKFDKNKDSYLSKTELDAIKEINVGEKGITNLQGINFFPNLEKLDCNNNQLTTLNVTSNLNLKELYCYENQLTELNVWENDQLTDLACAGNQLTELDVQYNTKLVFLSCYGNQLTSLDVSKNPALEQLFCSRNNLTSLDVSKNPALVWLNCMNNQLTSLDVSQNTNLAFLSCDNNKIDIKVEETPRTFDLSTLPGFDVTKTSGWGGGTVSGKTLRVNTGATQVTYTYDCGKGYKATFTLNVTVVPEGSIGIDALNFPDPNFRAYVKAKFDKDKNNCLSESERNAVTEIDVRYKNISNLSGIEFFPNLKKLNCSYNQLTSLDVSKNTKLSELDCYENQLTSLDVSQTAVTTLNASVNKITIEVEETSRTFDLRTLPGKFDVTKAANWSGGTVSGKKLKVNEGENQVTYTYNCGKDRSETFTLNVKVVPDGTVTPPSGGDTPGGSTGGGDGGGAIVIVAAVGAAAAGVVGYGVYNYVSGQKLQALLPEGVAAPENRAQTALLLWNTAGRPEPAEAPAFADVADPDTAKAAQWCVEQGLMKRRLNGKFAPGSSIPAYQVLNAYRKLAK